MPVGLFERMFRRTYVFKQAKNGKFIATDITNLPDDQPVLKAGTKILNLRPDLIFPVTGLKNIDRICFQESDGIELIDLAHLHDEVNHNQMSERMLFDMLEDAHKAGKYETEGTGIGENKMEKQVKAILILSILTLLVSIGSIYMSRLGK